MRGEKARLTVMRTRVFIAAVVLLSVVARIGGQAPSERETLEGLGPIRVVVEEMRSDAERDGLTKRMLQTAVELRLRQNGIPLDEDVFPYLYLRINTSRNDRGVYAFCITAAFKQGATLSTGLAAVASTWDEGSVGTVGADNLCSAPGFLDSGLKVITSTRPRPARRNRVALGLDSDSRTSPASTVRCTSA